MLVAAESINAHILFFALFAIIDQSMNLLLTSDGISNPTIADALQEMVGKDPHEASVAFIPTAANPERRDKTWMIKNMSDFADEGYSVDVIELTAFGATALQGALEKSDVICVGGGNAFYLSHWMQKSGLFEMMPDLLTERAYVGISAGSMIAGQSLALSSQAVKHRQAFLRGDYDALGSPGEVSAKTLGLANIAIRPHLGERVFSIKPVEGFEQINRLEEIAKAIGHQVYALDNHTALQIIDGETTVVSEGEWLRIPSNVS